MKNGIKIFIMIFAFTLATFFLYKGVDFLMLRTDSGWDSSYDSGGWDSGGWDSGGWDNDYDYDYDYDYSNDWGSSSGNRNSSTYVYSKEDYKIFLLITIFYVSLFALIFYFKLRKPKIKKTNDNYRYYSSTIYLSDEEKARYANRIEEVTGISCEKLKKDLFKIYKDIQISWMNFDYKKLRTLCNDEIYNTYKTQLETLKLKEQQNVMENFVLDHIYFLSPVIKKDVISVSIILKVYQNDYIIDSNSSKVVHGRKDRTLHMTYKLSFECKKNETNNCPNCGGQIKEDTSKCDYCGSIIVQGKGKFVLVRKEVLEQR